MKQQQVPREVLLDGAQMSLTAFLAGTMGFLKGNNIDIEEWTSYIGGAFEDSLSDLQGRGADEVMEHLLNLEVLPLGAEVISSRMTQQEAEVAVTSLPSASLLEKFGTNPGEMLEAFDISPEEFEKVFACFEPAATAIGMRFTHGLRDGQEILTLEHDTAIPSG